MEAVFEIDGRFWAPKTWRPNLDERAKKTKCLFDIIVSIHLNVTSEQTFHLFIRL